MGRARLEFTNGKARHFARVASKVGSPLMKTRRIAETERTIDVIPPLTIFVDESGSVDFGVPKKGACKKALAVVAIAVQTMHFEAFRIMLPRNVEGRFLKAQDK